MGRFVRLQLAFFLLVTTSFMHTPGIRRALKALARAKRTNANKAAHGRPVTIAGKKMSAATYKRHFGLPSRLKK